MATIGQIVWVVGIVAWYVIRYPFERRAKRVRTVGDYRSPSERFALSMALLGMAVVPALYIATGIPEAADYPARPVAIVAGALIVVAGLWVFRRAHKDLGRNWSVSLEIREKHKLVTTGLYAYVRHPMYSSFLLIALGQAFLLSNWVAGLAGLAGFAVLYFMRIGAEERMMADHFGDEYRAYAEGTKRIIPFIL
jgi:protein-S-isoprenylcysteine O-methyltransferase Ste14